MYTRVSTKEQADSGYSLETQAAACQRYAELHGLPVVTPALKEDFSGAVPISNRPAGKMLVSALKRREADTVIVYCVDRLSRDIVDLLVTVREWLGMGVEIH